MVSLVSVHVWGFLFDIYIYIYIYPALLFSCASWIPGSVFWCYPWTLSVLWPGNGLLLLLVCPCSLSLLLTSG